jgi:hypothetical protein
MTLAACSSRSAIAGVDKRSSPAIIDI